MEPIILDRVCGKNEKPKIIVDVGEHKRVCLDHLHKFSFYDQTDHKSDPLNITRYCDKREIIIKASELGEINSPLKFEGLLPNQAYLFSASLKVNNIQIDKPLVKPVCTEPAKPLLPPHTDIGSFQIMTQSSDLESSLKNNETYQSIRLFWRPLPLELRGASDTNYFLECTLNDSNRTVFTEPKIEARKGHTDLTKRSSDGYWCRMVAENDLGISEKTRISLPSSEHLITPAVGFKFYVVNIAEHRVIVRWTHIDEDEPSFNSATRPRDQMRFHDGFYTIYWCYGNIMSDCNSLAGLTRVNSTPYELDLPTNERLSSIKFAISYWRESDKSTSGMVWAKCIAHKSPQFLQEPLEIYDMKLHHSSTTLGIGWSFGQCESFSAVIDSYEINYCAISRLDGCSVVYSNPSNEDYLVYRSLKDPVQVDEIFDQKDKNCFRFNMSNKLVDMALMENLTPSTGYMIRVRYFLPNRTSNVWSEILFAHTAADSEDLRKCWSWVSIVSTLIIVFFFISGYFIYPKSKKMINHYYCLVFRFKSARSSVTKLVANIPRQDDLGEMALKYCIDREDICYLACDSDMLADAATKQDSSEFMQAINREESSAINLRCNNHTQRMEVTDYVPSCLLSSQSETTPERSTESMEDTAKSECLSYQDEISITSHSSFLEKILSPEPTNEASYSKRLINHM